MALIFFASSIISKKYLSLQPVNDVKSIIAMNVLRKNVLRTSPKNAQLAELVDASVSNTDRKLCRFDSGAGYTVGPRNLRGLFCYKIS